MPLLPIRWLIRTASSCPDTLQQQRLLCTAWALCPNCKRLCVLSLRLHLCHKTIVPSITCGLSPVKNPSTAICAPIGDPVQRPSRGTCPSTIAPAAQLFAAHEFHVPRLLCHVSGCRQAWTRILPAPNRHWCHVALLCYLLLVVAVIVFGYMRYSDFRNNDAPCGPYSRCEAPNVFKTLCLIAVF